jgi:hypothetical protein
MLCDPTATTKFATEIVFDMTLKASNHMKRKIIVKVNSGIRGSRGAAATRNLEVIDPGYDPDYTGTGYSVQGSTLPLLISDLNHHKSNPITLSYMIVVLSRVKEWLCNRVMPFKLGPGGTDHLLKLSFSPEYRQWLACYDENGYYKEHLKRDIKEFMPQNPNVTKVTRPRAKILPSSATASISNATTIISTAAATARAIAATAATCRVGASNTTDDYIFPQTSHTTDDYICVD